MKTRAVKTCPTCKKVVSVRSGKFIVHYRNSTSILPCAMSLRHAA